MHDTTNDAKAREWFGPYGVQIPDPVAFFHEVTAFIPLELGIREALVGPVVYIGRVLHGTTQLPGPVEFLKDPVSQDIPPVAYKEQQEVRAVWRAAERSCQATTIRIANAAHFIKRLG